jgi:hypothetical protein
MLGPQHSFYVSQVGQTSDAAVRDRLLQGMMRGTIMRQHLRSRLEPSDRLGRAAYLLCMGNLVAVQFFVFAVLFVALVSWGRAGADRATGLRAVWQVAIAALVLPVPAAGAMIALRMSGYPEIPSADLWALVALPVLFVLVLCLIAAVRSRTGRGGLFTAWRGALRRVLPAAMALLALCYLGCGIAAMEVRGSISRDMEKANWNEVTYLAQQSGSEWTNPKIPRDAWSAVHPRKPAEK